MCRLSKTKLSKFGTLRNGLCQGGGGVCVQQRHSAEKYKGNYGGE